MLLYICIHSMVCLCLFCCFFFKQKTAYEMRISDWSSDVCSSDLIGVAGPGDIDAAQAYLEVADWLMFDARPPKDRAGALPGGNALAFDWALIAEIGRASCRERVCQYV